MTTMTPRMSRALNRQHPGAGRCYMLPQGYDAADLRSEAAGLRDEAAWCRKHGDNERAERFEARARMCLAGAELLTGAAA